MFSFYSPLHFLRVEIKKELRQVDYISVDVFTSPRGPPDWLRWLANNLPNNYWPRTTKRNIKKILPTQNKKATRAFHFPNSFSVSWIWLASISQSYRENLMRVFLLLLSFFFLILLPRLCFASFSFLSFCFFSRLFCVQLAVQQTTFSARDVQLLFSLFFCPHRCLLIRQPNCWGRALIRDGESFEHLFFFFLLFLTSSFFLFFTFPADESEGMKISSARTFPC